MALPIYPALRDLHPGCRVSVVCNYPDLLRDNPYAAPVDADRPEPDLIVDLRSGPRQAYRVAHYARLAGVPVPTARPCLYYEDWHTPQLESLGDRYVAVAAGASWPTKRWGNTRWRAVCRAVQDMGYRVVELGHAGEQIGVGVSLAGQTSIREAACVLHSARLLVTCDSGLMHLGLAAGTRVLALFGPTDPDILVRDEPLLDVVRSRVECRGCWNRRKKPFTPGTCPESTERIAPGRTPCMEQISVEQVTAALQKILS
ncbi:MAG: glycosyltransferase family 9 protein [Candidatus Hydrogenedentes bacterium]|nr:glycosyltransferase family 9 protein [Candidatus Hydrogenedentota bacterium]